MSDVDTAKELAGGDFDAALEHAIEFGMAAGAKAERDRIAAIVRSAEAEHCGATALMLALHESRIDVACARTILRQVPAVDAPTSNVVDVAARRAALKLIERKPE
ncbi:hypothetical protein GPL21_33400 [Bradyrhizobium pachyrhizi]|uniref:Uncharacterized protein n=1 Tax=Bradyrhizobium pachyrhizi TaxID=280333 RepID=A0A844T377_9BRAD|nr:hypothetical protein [Bradyrhizobium pachyrhizi]MVT69982.1 hypothetical protein [Bradyrhizobium pachyrhizi]